jgi:hypothetical protein
MKLYWRYKKDGKWTWKKAKLAHVHTSIVCRNGVYELREVEE